MPVAELGDILTMFRASMSSLRPFCGTYLDASFRWRLEFNIHTATGSQMTDNLRLDFFMWYRIQYFPHFIGELRGCNVLPSGACLPPRLHRRPQRQYIPQVMRVRWHHVPSRSVVGHDETFSQTIAIHPH